MLLFLIADLFAECCAIVSGNRMFADRCAIVFGNRMFAERAICCFREEYELWEFQ